MRRQPREELAVKLLIMGYPKRLAGLPFFVHRDEHGKLLVGIASDKLFHISLQYLHSKGFCSQFMRNPAAALS